MYQAGETYISEAQMTYDANGNLTRNREDVRMAYDAYNRLVKVSVSAVTVAEYVYDADNRRMEKVVTNGGVSNAPSLNGTTRYYYQGWRVLEEHDGSDNLQRQYTYGNYLDEVWTIDDRNGVTVEQLNSTTGSVSDRHFAHCNTLYHVYALTDEKGTLVEGYEYDAYGKATVFTGKGADGNWFTSDDVSANWSGVANPYQYTGQRYDPETELMYYKNRYFDTDLGRFIHRDPIGYRGGLNLYEYVDSSPILKKDPYGLVTFGQVMCNIGCGAFCLLACPSSGPGAILCGVSCGVFCDATCNPSNIGDDTSYTATFFYYTKCRYDYFEFIPNTNRFPVKGCTCKYSCKDGSRTTREGKLFRIYITSVPRIPHHCYNCDCPSNVRERRSQSRVVNWGDPDYFSILEAAEYNQNIEIERH